MAGPSRESDEMEALLNLEANFEKEGRQEAEQVGAATGEKEGYALGWQAGSALSAELEFMHGAARALIALSARHPLRIPDRAVTYAEEIITKCTPSLASRGNDTTLDMDAYLGDMRGLFRRMAALAGLPNVRYTPQASRLSDLSF